MPDSSKPCVACWQPIDNKARVCQHCGSAQRSHVINIIATAVKWAAGLTAVLTLVVVASQVRSLVAEWQKNDKVVSDYVFAARQQFAVGDNKVSQALLVKAEKLAPTNMDVRNLRLEILMDSLRTFLASRPHDFGFVEMFKNRDQQGRVDFIWRIGSNYQDVLDFMEKQEMEQLVALGVLHASKQRQSTLLAHLAWLKLLQFADDKTDIDALFAKALKKDPDNIYANALYGAWLLSLRNFRYDDEESVKQACFYFNTALKHNPQEPWVWSLWHKSLSVAGFGAARVERLKVISDMRERGVEIGSSLSWSVLLDVFGCWYDEKSETAVESQRLARERFSADELLELFQWLATRAGCMPLVDNIAATGKSPDVSKIRLIYALGLLHEGAGNLDKALYIFSKIEFEQNSYTSTVVQKAIARVKRRM